jgi:hypothetical protein
MGLEVGYTSQTISPSLPTWWASHLTEFGLFWFPQDQAGFTGSREKVYSARHSRGMKTNSIRTRTQAIAGRWRWRLAPDVISATDQLAWDKTFPQSDKVIHQRSLQ